MTQLFIAEKPSLGRAIAAVLPGPLNYRDGYIVAKSGDIVTWCFGHLLELAKPDAYDQKYKRWQLSDLPIVPASWKLADRKDAKKQLTTIARLLKDNPNIVHAGDPDREGQLLVDEVLEYCGLSKEEQGQARRLLINDLNKSAVTKALQNMRRNSEFQALSKSALARSHADWLYGINMTRAFTLRAQKKGQKGVLSVGRVQTPVLGMVARRDNDIANFTSKTFYNVIAHLAHNNRIIQATWKPSEACSRYQDSEGRVVSKELALSVHERIEGSEAKLVEVEHKQTEQAAPLPFSLSALQIEAARLWGLSASSVLKSAQSLYEKHKAITYPRSDCRYLPTEHHQDSREVLKAIVSNSPTLSEQCAALNFSVKSNAWDDTKVRAHHAIIPTLRKETTATDFSGNEERIYELIARRYMMQFAKSALYAKACLLFEIRTGKFVATGKTLLESGWQSLRISPKGKKAKKPQAERYLPRLEQGTILKCERGQVISKQTEPPKAFTDASLLQAMTGISKYVEDEALRNILKETDGIGTESTRANIIETLFSRKLLARKGKKIVATELGQGLVASLPLEATLPDMTAKWEQRLRSIANCKDSYGPFMDDIKMDLNVALHGNS